MKNDREGLFYRFLRWRQRNIKESTFVLIVSFFVGIGSATAAILLKQTIHFIQGILTSNLQEGANYWLLIYPVIGILLAGLFVKDRKSVV
jgi:CIC family chloride channel protein